MRPAVAARWTILLLVIAFQILVAYVYGFATRKPHPYGPDIVASGDYALRGLVPVAAGWAAYVAAPLGRYLDAHAVGRSRLLGLTELLWPIVGVTMVAYLTIQLYRAASVGALSELGDATPLLMIALGLSAIVIWTLFGATLGSLTSTISAPVLAIALHLFYVFLPALNLPWPRQLPGVQVGCCALWQQPASPSLATGAIFLCGIAITAWATTRARRVFHRIVAMFTGLVATGLIAGLLAANGPLSTQHVLAKPRPDVTVCSGTDPVVCLWPESAEDLGQVSAWLTTAQDELSAHDYPRFVRRISDYEADPAMPHFGYSQGADRSQVLANAAFYTWMHQLPNPGCGGDPSELQGPSLVLANLSGADLDELNPSPFVLDQVQPVLDQPNRAQAEWLRRQLTVNQECEQ